MGETKYRSLRGMPDILPETAARMRNVENVARDVFDLYGFGEMRTPILEATEVFTTGVGENTDIVEKEMYTFTDRGGKSVSLRPEGTAPIIRAFVEHGLGNSSEVVKIFYSGPMFRGERPQKGRLRQFHQIGAETIGSSDPCADAELILTLESILRKTGVTGHTIFVNSLGCADDRNEFSRSLSKYLGSRFEELCENCKRRAGGNVLRVLDCKSPSCRKVVEGSPEINGFLCGDCVSFYSEFKDILTRQKVSFREKRDLVRGLDYYTGVIFEASHPSLGAQDAFAAGGRYDSLSLKMGGSDISASGYAIGVERLLLALQDTEAARSSGVLVIPTKEDLKVPVFHFVEKLRDSGIFCEMDLTGRSLKAQMRKAGKEKRDHVIFVDKDQRTGDKVSLKDMDTGEQKDLGFDELVEILRKGKGKNDKNA
jgi:histidyl-tRNA synthetase